MYAQTIPKKIYLDYVLKPPGRLCVIDTPLPDRNQKNITKKLNAHNKAVVSIFALIGIFRCRNPTPPFELIRSKREVFYMATI